MSAKLTLVHGGRCVEPERPSGYTPEVLKALAEADVLLRQTEEMLKAAPVEKGSEASFEIAAALKDIDDARYNVNWRDEEGTVKA
jgi:hypothetical protein